MQNILKSLIEKEWVAAISDEFDIKKTLLKTKKFRRKVYDNYLMHIGGRY